MNAPTDARRGPDRRRQARGGRRQADGNGFAPLVMLVGEGRSTGEMAEAVLAGLKFAVATSASTDAALQVLGTLRPDIILAGAADAARIRMEAPEHLSVIEVSDAMRTDPHALIDAVRERLRANLIERPARP